MMKKLLLTTALLIGLSGIWNGYYQTTEVTFEGIQETCYGTLLSRKSESGTWSYQMQLDLNAPDEVLAFFREYQDPDHFFYLNYFQDVTDGLLYWPYYPPEEFKILLYFPGSGTCISSDQPIQRYSLNSPFKAVISDGKIAIERNYNYARLILNMLVRVLFGVAVAVVTAVLYAKPYNNEIRYMTLGNLLYQLLINALIAYYSFKNGFSYVEYVMFMWLPYLLWFLLQGFLLARNARGVSLPYLCSFFSCFVTYFAGLLLVDVLPKLFTIT